MVPSSADIDARLLVCAACGIDHGALIRDPRRPLGAGAARLVGFATRRLAHEPVSRILGRREFWGLSLAVDEAVLDPRPETEGLVGSILDAVGGRADAAVRILDLGTGSGAVLCALLTDLPKASGVGVDRSLAACRVAARNIVTHGLGDRAHVVCASWGDGLDTRFDVVVSNPPYVRRDDIAGLTRDVRDYDPVAALDGGPDGFDAFRAILPRLNALLALTGIAAFECGYDQADCVASAMRDIGLVNVLIHRDLAGCDRVVVGTRAHGPI